MSSATCSPCSAVSPTRARAAARSTALQRARVSRLYPVRAVTHPIRRRSALWRPYMARHRQNEVWQYHNGGIWPMVGGFWVVALAAAGRLPQARLELVKLARACARAQLGVHRMAARHPRHRPRHARAVLERRRLPHGRARRGREAQRRLSTERSTAAIGFGGLRAPKLEPNVSRRSRPPPPRPSRRHRSKSSPSAGSSASFATAAAPSSSSGAPIVR